MKINNKIRYQAVIHQTYAYKLKTGKRFAKPRRKFKGGLPIPKTLQEMIKAKFEEEFKEWNRVYVKPISVGIMERIKKENKI